MPWLVLSKQRQQQNMFPKSSGVRRASSRIKQLRCTLHRLTELWGGKAMCHQIQQFQCRSSNLLLQLLQSQYRSSGGTSPIIRRWCIGKA